MKTKCLYFLLVYLLAFCFPCKSQVHLNLCVNQTLPLSLSQGAIINESCLNSFNGSATVNVSGGKLPYSFSWNTTPAQYSQTATGLSAGSYTATVVDANNCTNTLSIIITRSPSPLANFSNTTECNTTATQFTDSSNTLSGTISAWIWNFNDGSSLNTNQSPSHTFTNAGNYNVSLIVNNSFGCSDTVIKPVQVYYMPIASYLQNDVCYGDSMHFINTSSVDPSTSIVSYLWQFGDGTPTSNTINAVHYYITPGTYALLLLATTSDGCSNVINSPVKVYDSPSSAFTISNSCVFNSSLFTNTTTNPINDSIGSWLWDFGDSSPLDSSIWSPIHIYSNPGIYQITLITQSATLGCSDTLHDSVTVFPSPVAKFGFTNVCLNQQMNFNDSSTISNGTINSWNWNFGDSSPISNLQNPSHNFANPGTEIVSLIVTTGNGCSDTVSRSVIVHPLPNAQFSSTNMCNGIPVPFTDGSQILATDTIQSWKWNFGDGSQFNSNQNTAHQYAAAGSYPVQFIVVSNFGCKDSITKTISVHPNPEIFLSVDNKAGCEPLCVNFKDSSSIQTGSNAHWLWNFGDGTATSNSQNILHCYSNDSVFLPNLFTVTLTVTSDSGCVTTKSENNYITVYPNPTASFTIQPNTASIINPVISITNLSVGANFWLWNFGNNNTSSLQNPLPHSYADTGTYFITLLTSTLYNCIDSSFQTINIEPDFLFYIPSSFTPNNDDINDNFSGKGSFITEFEMRIFDRWGELIYCSNDINKPWDGKLNHGTDIIKYDLYVYTFQITDTRKRKHTYNGTVTLVK